MDVQTFASRSGKTYSVDDILKSVSLQSDTMVHFSDDIDVILYSYFSPYLTFVVTQILGNRLCKDRVRKIYAVVRGKKEGVYIIIERVPCIQFSTYIKARQNTVPPVKLLRHLLIDSLLALKCLHDNKIVHNSIRPSSMCLNTDTCKTMFLDFKQACVLESTYTQCAATEVDIDDYSSPELVDSKTSPYVRERHGIQKVKLTSDFYRALDVWALGTVFVQLYRDPIPREYYMQGLYKKLMTDIDQNPIDPVLDTAVRQMLTYDYKERPTVDQIYTNVTTLSRKIEMDARQDTESSTKPMDTKPYEGKYYIPTELFKFLATRDKSPWVQGDDFKYIYYDLNGDPYSVIDKNQYDSIGDPDIQDKIGYDLLPSKYNYNYIGFSPIDISKYSKEYHPLIKQLGHKPKENGLMDGYWISKNQWVEEAVNYADNWMIIPHWYRRFYCPKYTAMAECTGVCHLCGENKAQFSTEPNMGYQIDLCKSCFDYLLDDSNKKESDESDESDPFKKMESIVSAERIKIPRGHWYVDHNF